MPKMYNPDTQEVVDVDGREVRDRKDDGFLSVGNRPESEYLGRTREEILGEGEGTEEGTALGEAPEAPESVVPEAPEEPVEGS